MIEFLISDPTKKVWINLKLYFESYEFSHSRSFLNFFEFILDLFGFFKIIKKSFLYRALTWQLMWRGQYCVTTWQRMCAHMCARECACVRVGMITRLSILFKIYVTRKFCAVIEITWISVKIYSKLSHLKL